MHWQCGNNGERGRDRGREGGGRERIGRRERKELCLFPCEPTSFSCPFLGCYVVSLALTQILIACGFLPPRANTHAHTHTQRTALEACHKGWGVSTIIGVAGSGQGEGIASERLRCCVTRAVAHSCRDLNSAVPAGDRSCVEGNSIWR